MNTLGGGRRPVKETEEAFGLLADQVPQFIWMTGAKGIEVTYSNRPFLEFLGLSTADQFLERGWDRHVHPDDIGNVFSVYGIAADNRSAYDLEARFKHAASGEYRWFLIHGMPRFDRIGLYEGFIGTAVDISGFKGIELAVKAEEQNEGQQPGDVGMAQLEQSNLELLGFARATSQDLQEQVRRYSLSDDTDVFEAVDLDELMKNVVADLEIVIQEKNASIECADLPAVMGIPILMYQLFYDLMANALKFSRKGVRPLVRVSGTVMKEGDLDFVRLVMSDNGVGLTLCKLCKKIVDRHGGRIEAKAGSSSRELIILLPAVRP